MEDESQWRLAHKELKDWSWGLSWIQDPDQIAKFPVTDLKDPMMVRVIVATTKENYSSRLEQVAQSFDIIQKAFSDNGLLAPKVGINVIARDLYVSAPSNVP